VKQKGLKSSNWNSGAKIAQLWNMGTKLHLSLKIKCQLAWSIDINWPDDDGRNMIFENQLRCTGMLNSTTSGPIYKKKINFLNSL
jgi:hypothetical protein